MKKLIIVFLFAVTNIWSQDFDANLLLHYTFDGNAIDNSGNNYNGTISGVTFGLDRFGNPNAAAYFDGIDDFIDLPNLLELKPDLPVSFSFWIKYDSEAYQDRAVFNTSFENDRSSGVYFNTQISTGNYAINYGDGTYFYNPTVRRTYISSEPIDITTWHHIGVVVRSATDMNIYVDCVEYGGQYSGSGGDLVYSNTPGSIGRRDRDLGVPAHYFKGALDEFRYWDSALTISEITDLCSSLQNDEFDVSDHSIIIYPNPSTGILNIKTEIMDLEYISIYNIIGQQVYFDSYKSTIDISHLSSGTYYINVSKENFSERQIIIVNSFHK